ncbi:MAG: SPOR domain-containing protein [Bacteroidaceae bacterium]|nr:SPOR domain-containing protein [Bacteroides sp.]MBO5079767.1 SPOR domain-containing protein [Bacteroidaceae bacterium]MBQ4590234.1 SPOR domain-containing protein [Bacteroidaceae bacterium]
MRYFLFLIGLFLGLSVSAQKSIVDELQKNRVGQGTVTIHQDARISALLGSAYVRGENETEPKVLKMRGYRVQVYAGNNSRIARKEANEVANQIKQEFPDLSVYAFFLPPRWLCRVGDYKSIEEADATMRRLKTSGKFKEVSIVREQINIPLE